MGKKYNKEPQKLRNQKLLASLLRAYIYRVHVACLHIRPVGSTWNVVRPKVSGKAKSECGLFVGVWGKCFNLRFLAVSFLIFILQNCKYQGTFTLGIFKVLAKQWPRKSLLPRSLVACILRVTIVRPWTSCDLMREKVTFLINQGEKHEKAMIKNAIVRDHWAQKIKIP